MAAELLRHILYLVLKMSYSKQWDSKVMVATTPFKINKYIVCYNCRDAWLPEHMNVCTGLCPTCAEKNVTPLQVPSSKFVPSENARKCNCCNLTKISNGNFGIVRENCRMCINQPAMVQRCICCDSFNMDCWNNICEECRYGNYFCEKTGEFFSNENVHFKKCWCLDYDQRVLRYKMMTNRTHIL